MDVNLDPSLALEMLRRLKAANQKSRLVEPYVRDYQVVLDKSRILEVRVVQLAKECSELREEVLNKEERLLQFESKLGKIEAAEKLEQELIKVKAENAALVEQKEMLEKDIESRELERQAAVSHGEALSVELSNVVNKNNELALNLAAVEADLKNERTARELAVDEYTTNKDVVDQAQKDKEALEIENHQLVERLKIVHYDVEKKMVEVSELQMELDKQMEDITRQRNELHAKEGQNRVFPWFPRGPKPINISLPVTQPKNPPDAIDDDWTSEDFNDLLSPPIQNPTQEYSARESKIPQKGFKAAQRHLSACTGAAFSPNNGSTLVTSGQGGALFIWDPSNRIVQKQLYEQMEGGLMDAAFSCCGNKIMAAAQDNSVRMWNIASGTQTILRGHQRGVNCVATSPADVTRGVSSGEDKRIIFWDLNKGVQLCSQKAGSTPSAVCITQEGNTIISGHANGTLRLWDVRIHPPEIQPSNSDIQIHQEAVAALSLFPTRKNLLLSAGKDNLLKVTDFRKNGVTDAVATLYHPKFVLGTIGYMGRGACVVGISPDDMFVAAGSTQGHVLVWKREDSPGRAKILDNNSHNNAVVACAWSPNWDNRVVSCDKDGVVVFWEDTADTSKSP